MNEAFVYIIKMVRFSCFNTQIHHHKSKKDVQRSVGSCSPDQTLKVSGASSSLNPLLFKAHYDNPSSTSAEQVSSSSFVDHCWKTEEMHSSSSPEGSIEVHQKVRLKKSQSLGSGLDREGRSSSSICSEEEMDQGFPRGHFYDKKSTTGFDYNGMGEPFDSIDPGINFLNQYHEAQAESFRGNDSPVHNKTIFSIGDPKQLEGEGHEDFATRISVEHADDCGPHTPRTPSMISKSFSLPNMAAVSPTSGEGSLTGLYVGPQYRSSEDLLALDAKGKELINHELGSHPMEDQERDNNIDENRKDKCENPIGDGFDSCDLNGLVKDWTIPGMDEVDMMENHEREPSVPSWDELPSKEFKIKRIEEWVSTIDLEDSSSVQEMGESSHSTDKLKKGSSVLGSVTTAKVDAKITLGMEAAKKYISSLTPTSTSAHLANLGLVVIPFLSAFVSLKVLNLSGNGIVRITSGALPRGLHMLNLAKNNISTIEGFRELTRLRVLDLSYNRILRIGHGLASCSSLKELYLAGNKISEVEGLHRLLKLNILDLRFNKISTAKCLGQLAANYSSLQAINLEGNPAQRNVGDEQLKKYLQGLLPHLAYFNKQPIRAGSSKEVADRPARSAITAHQFDRGLRSEHKLTRKGAPSLPTSKASSSLSHGHTNLRSSPKRSKDRHGRLPPSGTKGAHRHHHYLDLGNKLLSLQTDLSMRRSQSEGNLGAS